MKTERMVILLTREQKRGIAAKAKALNLSAAEVVRRAVDTYRPGADDALLLALADELKRSVVTTRAVVASALGELRRTSNQLADRQRRRKAA